MITKIYETPLEEHLSLREIVKNVILTTTPRSHGLGMLQFQVDQEVRVHVWHPRLSRFSTEETGHQHRFDMVSTVLHGSIVQIDVTPIPGKSHTFVEFDENLEVHKTHEMCDLERKIIHIREGSTYSMKREQYHQFEVEEMAITYVRRLGLGGRSKALFPVEIEPRSGRYDNMQEDVEKTLLEVRSLVQDWRS